VCEFAFKWNKRLLDYRVEFLPVTIGPGTRLGPYEITAQIGVGGTGEVYRALDTNLGRQVAIKILPDAFAQDPDRLARFEREAKTLASLNHPHMCSAFDFGRQDGIDFLVMEYLEGETLADCRHVADRRCGVAIA
jgi:serine/threonine protein kinase